MSVTFFQSEANWTETYELVVAVEARMIPNKEYNWYEFFCEVLNYPKPKDIPERKETFGITIWQAYTRWRGSSLRSLQKYYHDMGEEKAIKTSKRYGTLVFLKGDDASSWRTYHSILSAYQLLRRDKRRASAQLANKNPRSDRSKKTFKLIEAQAETEISTLMGSFTKIRFIMTANQQKYLASLLGVYLPKGKKKTK